ncbi:hypothetical protein [Pelagicoccus sp. SDUM812003]|uniref:aspartate/ornithine carbamoyltransferase family protein n=1 Tax=Pelagicoccus sp. SDUM812003 TaxID=3041267 RepID=UPI00280C8A34|nr:hypothetical protein [Pelagicoccus sp. SDUM812003]MDQ8202899.1 hypothetical protein [Pelagicoccus sp. SDUM812003]
MSDKLELNKRAEFLSPPDGVETLRPEPNSLFENNPVRLSVLRALEGRSILSVKDFTREEVIEIAKLAAILENFEIAPYHIMDGKIVTTAFFEASTRTRLSFESAVLRLDGKVLSIPEGGVTGVRKGESLDDIGMMFNAYCDMVIMRHTETDSLERLTKGLRVPLINAGNGSGEHPTQSLADWYALLKWRPKLAETDPSKRSKKLCLGILGTPGSMRAVKSFLLMSLMFQDRISKVIVISQMADPFGEDLVTELEKAGIQYKVTNNMKKYVPKLDVIYMNSIAFLGDSYKNLDAEFQLNKESELKEEAVILHPLARLSELDKSLDDTAHNLYFSQAHGAVFVRQALLIAISGRLDRLPKEIPVVD